MFPIFVLLLQHFGMVFSYYNPTLISFTNMDYTFTGKGNTTTLTGVRAINESTSDVYMSGFTWINFDRLNGIETNHAGFIYKGPVLGGGMQFVGYNFDLNLNYLGIWYGNFYFPSDVNRNVTSTYFYGPCNGSTPDTIQAVGTYETSQGGAHQYGLYYHGYLNGTGTWKTIVPQVLAPDNNILGTVGHSMMGNLIVGNFNTNASFSQPRAFVYDISLDNFTELSYSSDSSTNAYCIWHYGGNSYAIAGGVMKNELENAFIVNWDASTNSASDWRFFRHENSTKTHFQGMYPNYNDEGSISRINDYIMNVLCICV